MLTAVPNGNETEGDDGLPIQRDNVPIRSKRSLSSDDRHAHDSISKRIRSEDRSDDNLTSASEETEAGRDPEEDQDIHDIQTSKAFLLTVGKIECTLRWLEIDPIFHSETYDSYPSDPWKNGENLDPNCRPFGSMMTMMNPGNYGNTFLPGPQYQWQSFPHQHDDPPKFHPMMMGMGNYHNSFPCGPAGPADGGEDNSERYYPKSRLSASLQHNDRVYNHYYDSNHGPGINGQGPYIPQGMNYPGQLSQNAPDERDYQGQNFPPNMHRQQYYHGPYGQSGNNNMMGMNCNFNDFNNGHNSRSPYPPMNMQHGYSNPEYFRRKNGNGGRQVRSPFNPASNSH